MKEKQLLEKGLADLAYKVEADHEVQMARAEIYKVAKYAIKLHEMLKGVSEEEGLEGWVQSKITKAADYMASVYHHMDYENAFEAVKEAKKDEADVDESGIMYKAGVKKYGKDGMKKIQSAAGKGASAEEIGAIKDKHNKKKKESVDPYKESLAAKLEEKKKSKGLYYNVNKRKKAGTSRSKNHPDAPSEKDWENAAKTAKESVDSKKKTFELDKKTIKQAHKTADKINDKPKAKKSIAKWAKEKGMDPEGAVYAIATNMAKKK